MTREERHIAVLNRLLENMDVYDSIQPTTERKKAIKAAIQALENHDTFMKYAYSQGKQDALSQEPCDEPCDDAISRDAVIEHFRNALQEVYDRNDIIYELEYEIPSVTQKSTECDDAISRADFESHLFENYCVPVSKIGKPNQYSSGCFYKDVVKCLDDLPPITQKSGKWIAVTNGRGGHECSLCHEYAPSYQDGDEWLTKYCPNCGAKMFEPQESEG